MYDKTPNGQKRVSPPHVTIQFRQDMELITWRQVAEFETPTSVEPSPERAIAQGHAKTLAEDNEGVTSHFAQTLAGQGQREEEGEGQMRLHRRKAQKKEEQVHFNLPPSSSGKPVGQSLQQPPIVELAHRHQFPDNSSISNLLCSQGATLESNDECTNHVMPRRCWQAILLSAYPAMQTQVD
eukprot:4336284-Amphidinium_carterae.1